MSSWESELMSGLKRLDTGALVKDYEGPDKEIVIAYQMAVSDVTFEDERYIVCSFLATWLISGTTRSACS